LEFSHHTPRFRCLVNVTHSKYKILILYEIRHFD
jgi:hypothetical protein